MKKIFILLTILVMVLGLSLQAHAALELLGQGTSTHGTYNLIYDSDFDITWYDFSYSSIGWDDAVAWTGALSVTFGGNTYTDWRLPTVTDIGNDGCNWGYSGTDCGYNVDTSTGEMAHLWYDELGNVGQYDTSGNLTGCGYSCLTYTGDFQHLQANLYWSGTEYAPYNPIRNVWYFYTGTGLQLYANDDHTSYYAIAVRPGLAVVPEPVSMILFGTGGLVLVARRKLLRRRNR